jgi:ribosomal RNA-processing protein 17
LSAAAHADRNARYLQKDAAQKQHQTDRTTADVPPQLREQRKVDLEKHVSETNRLMRLANGDIPSEPESEDDGEEDPETFTGFDDPINQEDEYVDEDKYTTVTVETVGINRTGFSRPGEEAEELRKEREAREEAEKEDKKKRVWTKEKPKSDRPKKKKVKFRYETKAERKVERMKQGMKKKKLAEKRAKAKEE